MKISLEWLKDFVAIPWKIDELAHRLTMAGLEVEEVSGSGKETALTLGITPNRGDCLSYLGVAREVSALQGKALVLKKQPVSKGQGKIADLLQVQVLDPKGCPRYMARIIQGVTIHPSPSWMQQRLQTAGVRPINNVVDATNYVLLELGHPLHAFDYRFLKNQKIVVRKEKSRTQFVTLDGETRVCEPTDLFICDGVGPVALAGIMGGANSEVREETKTVVLEAAYFLPEQMHQTAKRLKIHTESSDRFERGVDPNGLERALHRVTEFILETAGGSPTEDWIDFYPKKRVPLKISLAAEEIRRILGIAISLAETERFLWALGFSTQEKKGGLEVKIPTYRFDMTQPIDLIEEVARTKGFEQIPTTLPRIQMSLPTQPKEASESERIVECLNPFGFYEACHLSFTSLEKATLFDVKEESMVFLENPLSDEDKVLRPTLFPSLLETCAFNLNRQRPDVKFFELRKVFFKKGDSVEEKRHFAAVACGNIFPKQWQLGAKSIDLFFLKGVLERLTETLQIDNLEFIPDQISSFLVSTIASGIYWKGQKVGWLGKLSPQILQHWEIEEDVFGFELDWEPLSLAAQVVPISFHKLSKFPFIERDVALVVDLSLPARRIEEAIWKEKNPWIQKVQLFDLFRGGSLPADKKSLALSIRYGSPDRTLTNEEVNEAHGSLISRLEQELSAQLRK